MTNEMQSAPGSSNPGAIGGGSNKAILAVGALIIVIAVAGGVFMYMSGGGKSAEAKVKDAFVKTIDATSATVDATLNIKGKAGMEGGMKEIDLAANVTMKGVSFDKSQEDKKSGEGSLSVTGTLEGEEVNVVVDIKSVPPKTYFKFTEAVIPEIPYPLDELTGSWYFVDSEDSEGFADFMPGSFELPETCKEDPEAGQDYLESVDPMRMFTEMKKVGSERLEDESATRYSMKLNTVEMAKIGREYSEAAGCPEEDMDDIFGDVPFENLEVVVGSTSGLVREISFSVAIPEDDGQFVGDVDATIKFSDFGKEVTVEEPEDAKSLEEAFFAAMFSGAMMEADIFMDYDPNAILEELGEADPFGDVDDEEMPSGEDFDAFIKALEELEDAFGETE